MTPRATSAIPAGGRPEERIYVAAPRAGRGPGVLVIHSWWGRHPFFTHVCDRLAQAGFVACAPDLFEGSLARSTAAARRLRAKSRRAPTHRTLIRALDVLAAHPAVEGRLVGVVGFSMGGHWACWLAQRADLAVGATVAFYGVRSGDYRASRSAFQIHLADHDAWVSDEARRRIRKCLHEAGRPTEFFEYPGTRHWFFESYRKGAYHAAAAASAWDRTILFLRARLQSEPQERRTDSVVVGQHERGLAAGTVAQRYGAAGRRRKRRPDRVTPRPET